LKIKINSCDENDAMYSTDDENEFSDASRQYQAERNSGGPYNIDPSKSYKPAFIVFLDMIITITFVMVSLMYFWVQIPDYDTLDNFGEVYKYFTFIPTNVALLWLVLAGKNLSNALYLYYKYGKDKANGSGCTSNLYWSRVYYDFLVIGGSLIMFSLWINKEKQSLKVLK